MMLKDQDNDNEQPKRGDELSTIFLSLKHRGNVRISNFLFYKKNVDIK